MGYGPDNNLELNFTQTITVAVPPRARAHFSFSFQAAWENAICIYDVMATTKLAERGNYSRSTAAWETPVNTSNQPVVYIVSGWHKTSPPDGGRPWVQSPGRQVLQNVAVAVIGFEDGADADFNDAVAICQLQYT